MTTNADIAKAAGVSPAIVSRIVNGDKTLRVSDKTRERVLALVKELDYSPNIAARTLKASKTGVIALVVHDLTSSVYAEIIEGAHKAAATYGKAILVGEAGARANDNSHLEALISGRGVDGLILQGAEKEMDKTLERAARHKMPTVLLQTGDPQKATVIQLDDQHAGRAATEHLLERGHRAIGYIGISDGLLFSDGRKAGWQQALRAKGIDPQPNWCTLGGNKFEGGVQATADLLRKAPDITGIVVGNIVSAIGVLAELHDQGRNVPEDISVIAVHDIPLAEYLRPSLSVVKMPLNALGQTAVKSLCEAEEKTELSPQLIRVDHWGPIVIARKSTDKFINV